MIVTPLGFAFVALFAALLIGGRSTFVYAIALSMFFQDSAMVVVAGIGLAPYSVAGVVALVLQIVYVLRNRRGGRSYRLNVLRADTALGRWLRLAILVLLVYGVLASAIGPAVFHGVQVMPSQGSSDYLVDRLPHLAYSVSNVAQIVYLVLNVVVVWFVSTLPRLPRTAFAASVGLVAVVALVALILSAAGVDWPFSLFDNSPRNYYASLVNDPRIRAQFSEPSHLALFLTMALAYGVRMLPLHGKYRVFGVGIILVATAAFLRNPSTTIILTLALLIPVALAVLAVQRRSFLLTRRGRVVVLIALVVLAASAIVFWAPLSQFLGPQLLGKVGSSSQYSRGKQDLNALSLLGQSLGLGVGLGSNRSSSLLTMLLSDLGVIGTTAYYAVIVLSIVILFRRRASLEGWALTALALACAISVADFVSPPTWFLVGVAAQLSRPSTRFGGLHRLPKASRAAPILVGASL